MLLRVSPTLSVVIITRDEEANLPRTLASVSELVKQTNGEIIVVDSGSTDRTVEIAKSFGAKVFVEEWKGYAAQKNSAIEKATGDWILSLDADEEVGETLRQTLSLAVGADGQSPTCEAADSLERVELVIAAEKGRSVAGFWVTRKNFFLGRWIRRGGFYPDWKLRLFRRGSGHAEERTVHETIKVNGPAGRLRGDLLHHAYPTLQSYIGHMNRYSTLGAEMAVAEGKRGFSLWNIVVRPWATFVYNYFFRLGFLDGREGLLLHLYHATYVSWKYAKAWEMSRKKS